MKIRFMGQSPSFLIDAFLDDDGGIGALDLVSQSRTEVVYFNSDTGITTTLTGLAMRVAPNGVPLAGAVTGMSFAFDGQKQGEVSGISWSFSSFYDALLDIALHQNEQALAALFDSSGTISVSGTDALDRISMYPLRFTLFYVENDMVVRGTDAPDWLRGGRGDDLILPGRNIDGFKRWTDVIDATDGNDTIDFGAAEGNDFYVLSYDRFLVPLDMELNVSRGRGTVEINGNATQLLQDMNAAMRAGGLYIEGGDANDTIRASVREDEWLNIAGGDGQDGYNLFVAGTLRLTFEDGTSLEPPEGIDVRVENSSIRISDDGFGNTGFASVDRRNDGLIEISGTHHADHIRNVSNVGINFIPRGGNDTLIGSSATDDRLRYDRSGYSAVEVDLLAGTATGMWRGTPFVHTISGMDIIRGSTYGHDTLLGDGGENTLSGHGGDDSLVGRGGDDVLYGWRGDDTLIGGAGVDRAYFPVNRDEALIERVEGGYLVTAPGLGTDFVQVEQLQFLDVTLETADLIGLSARTAAPLALEAHADARVLLGGIGDDSLFGTAEADRIAGSGGDDLLRGLGGADDLSGGAGRDTLAGGAGADTLTGGSGNDRLIGNDGDDRLDGGPGHDALTGGSGADVFVFSGGRDRITDFDVALDMIEIQSSLLPEGVSDAAGLVQSATYGPHGLILALADGQRLTLSDLGPSDLTDAHILLV